MSKVIGLAAIIVVGALAYRAMGLMDRAALAVTVGVLLGAMASIPTALLGLAAGRGEKSSSARPS